MTTANLKIDLINRITRVHDAHIINEIKRLLDFELEEGTFKLSATQRKRITVAKDEIRQKKTITERVANKEIDEWLGK
jgi:hypothetical protein